MGSRDYISYIQNYLRKLAVYKYIVDLADELKWFAWTSSLDAVVAKNFANNGREELLCF